LNKSYYIYLFLLLSCNNPNNELLNDLLDNQIIELNEFNNMMLDFVSQKAKDEPKEYHDNYNSLKHFKNSIENYRLNTKQLTYKNSFQTLITKTNLKIKNKP